MADHLLSIVRLPVLVIFVQVEPQLKTAVQAAAGQWRDAVTAAAAQHRASIFHPK